MIDNLGTTCEIQIDDKAPFTPDKVIRIGVEYEEIAVNDGIIRSYIPGPSKAIIHYVMNGKEFHGQYTYGSWEHGTNGMPRFHVRELLALKETQ